MSCGRKLLVPVLIFVGGALPSGVIADEMERAELLIGAGYRIDHLEWNIAGNALGANPNILSELQWDALQSAYIELGTRLYSKQDLTIEAQLGYGEILGGDVQDSDYSGDNRTREFSRSNNHGGGHVGDVSLSVGTERHVDNRRVNMGAGPESSYIPKIGFSYHVQNLRITDGVQTIPPLGPFAGLDSTYEAEWWGPWAGIDFRVKQGNDLTYTLGFAYHLADFYAKGDWNLRTDLAHPVSYEHDARADGWSAKFMIDGYIRDNWSYIFNLHYQQWAADPGLDTIYSVNQQGAVSTLITRLNTVKWQSMMARLQLVYSF